MIGRLLQSMACLAALAVPAAEADEFKLGPVPEQGVLLLRNGHSLQGKITRAGDLYYVALPHGEIRVRAAQVELCCRTVEEGYHRKRAGIRPGNVQDHLRLTQWCLRHDLLQHAAAELADAMDADPEHPMVDVLRRRLKVATVKPPPSRLAKPLEPSSSPEDLDRMVRGMPPGVVETFTQTIQPLLINNCTAITCHGRGSETDFRLLRTPVGRPPSRRLTQRNLHATLKWIDRQEPAASRLLVAPIRPHGTAEAAIFTNHKLAQYRQMVDWVHHVAAGSKPKVPVTVGPKSNSQANAMAAEKPGFLFSPDPQSAALPKEMSSMPSAVKRGAVLPSFVPKDPFDPEIFNRRFFGKK